MNKTIWIVAGLLLSLTAGVISNGIGLEMTIPSAFNQDDWSQPSFSPQIRQDENNTSAKNNSGNKSNAEKASDNDQSGPVMPDMDPSPDSPDAPVKTNVPRPIEEKSDLNTPEDQKQSAAESEPVKPADVPDAGKPTAEAKSPPEQSPAAVSSKSKPELSPALAALRDKVRSTLAAYQKMSFNTRQNTADEIIDFCLALGCNTEISLFEAGGQKRANAITCLCWNYPCGGYEPLTTVDGHICARLGYGTQSRPSELLAALAMARVQSTYPMRAGETVRTVADLVESEKLSCRSGGDMSFKLIGLAYYADQAAWRNDLDEQWSVEKIVKEELSRPIVTTSGAGLDRLMGLSYAIYRREKQNLPIEGPYAQAKQYIDEFQKFALGIQNSDGSWGYFLNGKRAGRDSSVVLRSSGHVLEWLAISLPEDRLGESAMASGINYLNNTLAGQRYQSNLPSLSTQEIAGAMRALHALAIYDGRLFKPADPEQPPPEKNPDAATAKKESGTSSSR